MPEKIKYNIAAKSKAPLISSLVALCSAALLCAVYWPVFVQYFAPGLYDGPAVGTIVVVFYGSLIAGLLLYSLLTGIFAKKTLVPSAIFALVPSLFYTLDISGLRNVIMFFDPNKTFSYYATKAHYFNAVWPFITILALLTILSAVCYFMLSANRHRGFATTFITLNAAGWLAFSIYYIAAFAAPDLASNAITTRDFVYTIITNSAAALFFVSQFIVAAAVKKAEAKSEKPAEMPVSIPSAEGDINLLSATPAAPPIAAPVAPPILVNNTSAPSEPGAEAPAVLAGNETAIDVVFDADSAQPEKLEALETEPAEKIAMPDVAEEPVEVEMAANPLAEAGEELSATDIDALAAVDSSNTETPAPDNLIETDTKKTAPKKKTTAKKPAASKKTSAKKTEASKKTAANTTAKQKKDSAQKDDNTEKEKTKSKAEVVK